MFCLQHYNRRILVDNSSFSQLDGSQGQITEVSPWKPMGARKDAGKEGGGPLELEVPSDVMLLLRAGKRDPQVAFRCSSFESSEISDLRKRK